MQFNCYTKTTNSKFLEKIILMNSNLLFFKKMILVLTVSLLAINLGFSQTQLVANAAPVTGSTTISGTEFNLCGESNYSEGSNTANYHYFDATTSSPCVSVTLDPTEQYTGVFVFEANASDPLGTGLPTTAADPCIASAFIGVFGNTDPFTADFAMTAGMRYYFLVATDLEGTTTFDIDLDVPVVPTPFVAMSGVDSDPAYTVADGTPLNFYDSGGPSCDYQLNENYTITVCPDAAGTAADKVIQLEFTAFDRNNTCLTSSEITFYKGMSATPGNEIFPGEYANIVYTEDIRVFTAITADGCMTVEWTNGNDTNCEGVGWEGNFSLVDNPCSSPVVSVCGTNAPFLGSGQTLNANSECFTTSAVSSVCGTGIDKPGWFRVVAENGADNINIDYQITGGNQCYSTNAATTSTDETSTDTGLQFVLYRGCGSDELCASGVILATGGVNVENGVSASGTWSPDISTVAPPPPGNIYYVLVGTFGGDLCDFSITAGAGIGAAPVCEASVGIFRN